MTKNRWWVVLPIVALALTLFLPFSAAAALTVVSPATPLVASLPPPTATCPTGMAHCAILTWTPSPTTSVTGVNVYRASCTGTVTAGACSTDTGSLTFTKLGSVAVGTATYTDGPLVAGASWVYYVTATCPATACSPTESAPSNHYAVTVPLDVPQPPVLLGIVSASLTTNGANAELTAAWIDQPGYTTNWVISSKGSTLASGTQTSSTGNFAVNWSGKIKPNSVVTLSVCDQANACESRVL